MPIKSGSASFNKTMFVALGQNIYFKKGRSSLNIILLVKRLLSLQPYVKNRRHP